MRREQWHDAEQNGCSSAARRTAEVGKLYLGPMRRQDRRGIILVMTRPNRSPRALPITDRPAPPTGVVQPVRRYRLAKLRLDARIAGSASRFEHLKRTYD